MDARDLPPLGISAIAVHQPPWELENRWFGDSMPRKFAHHTGIEARGISLDNEVTMGLHAVRRLQRETPDGISTRRRWRRSGPAAPHVSWPGGWACGAAAPSA
jgi:hypothetical protein